MIFRNLHIRFPQTPLYETGIKCKNAMCVLYTPDINETYDYSVQRIVLFAINNDDEKGDLEFVAEEYFRRTIAMPYDLDFTLDWISEDIGKQVKGVVALGKPLDLLNFALGQSKRDVEAAAYQFRPLAPPQNVLYKYLKESVGCPNANEIIRNELSSRVRRVITTAYSLKASSWLGYSGYNLILTFGIGDEYEAYPPFSIDWTIELLRRTYNDFVTKLSELCPKWTDEHNGTLMSMFFSQFFEALGYVDNLKLTKEKALELTIKVLRRFGFSDLGFSELPDNEFIRGFLEVVEVISKLNF